MAIVALTKSKQLNDFQVRITVHHCYLVIIIIIATWFSGWFFLIFSSIFSLSFPNFKAYITLILSRLYAAAYQVLRVTLKFYCHLFATLLYYLYCYMLSLLSLFILLALNQSLLPFLYTLPASGNLSIRFIGIFLFLLVFIFFHILLQLYYVRFFKVNSGMKRILSFWWFKKSQTFIF